MRTLITIGLAVTLVACTYNRETPGDFNLVSTSQVKVATMPAFTDCVSSAFRDRALPMGIWTSLKNRQQVRSNLTRVELVHSESGAVLSADIYQDGKVELWEQNLSFRPKYEDEQAAFAACVQRFK